MPTFLPALFGLYLPQLSQACGMAPQQTHFTDGIAEAQRGEGLPLSHTACKQKGWGLSHPPQSLFTWSLPVLSKYIQLWAGRVVLVVLT